MVRLLHLAPESLRRRIERSGLRGHPRSFDVSGAGDIDEPEVIFAMPVLEDFAATHQWVRELRRGQRGRLVAVHFRVPDDEVVLVGRYGPKKERRRAGEAVSTVRGAPWGQEIVVCRRVAAREIVAVRDIRQDVGWVETPDSDHKYQCVCQLCLPSGSPDVFRRCRAAFNHGVQRAHSGPSDAASVLEALRPLDLPLERVAHRLEAKKLLSFARHSDDRVRGCVCWLFGYFRREQVLAPLLELLDDPCESVRHSALEALVRVAGPEDVWARVRDRELDERAALIDQLEYWVHDSAVRVLRQIGEQEADAELSARATRAFQRANAESPN